MELTAAGLIEAVGYLGVLLTLGTYSMRRMGALRAMSISANITFIFYGLLASVWPQVLLHSILLPLNIYRLVEMRRLTRRVAAAARGDLSIDWLKPYMSHRKVAAGEVLFSRGEASDELYFTVSGQFRLREIDSVFSHGVLIGEIGLVSPDNARTLTFECLEAGEVMQISYDHVRELFYQNPGFGFHLLQLISRRLFNDIERLQAAGQT